MQRRHVRVVAEMAVVMIALTGGRRSGGGGCDDNDRGGSGGGSYSSSGGSTSGDSTSSSGGGTGGQASATPEDQDATADIKPGTCTYDEAAEKLNYTVTVTNSSSQAYEYSFYVQWEDTADNGLIGIYDDYADKPLTLGPGESRTIKAEDTYHFVKDNVRYRCTVDWALKSPVG
ncbi:hypothetical protein ABZ208_21965 [Streptomyces sp. NPDC006208]|uniref:hypothetical protein n=1 Tax=Streptomyces sp. NPDC006208 TaxID=3156734 RepID=UPI0033B55D74